MPALAIAALFLSIGCTGARGRSHAGFKIHGTADCKRLRQSGSILPFDVRLLPVYNISMKTTIDEIIAEVLSLSPQARAFIAEKLIESLDSEHEFTLSSAWRDEIRKRCREIDEGSVELREAADVFARGFAALG
jgi:putative addiction module component (TIGR02574 family)